MQSSLPTGIAVAKWSLAHPRLFLAPALQIGSWPLYDQISVRCERHCITLMLNAAERAAQAFDRSLPRWHWDQVSLLASQARETRAPAHRAAASHLAT